MGFEGIRAEVEDVLRMFNIIQIPIALPQVSQIGRPPVAGAKAAV